MGLHRWLRTARLCWKPGGFKLGNGERVNLCQFVGSGREKDVYRIRGRNEVIKIQTRGRPKVLEDPKYENILKELGIAYAASHQYDPERKWIIQEYVPEPTIGSLIKSDSELIFKDQLVYALFVLQEKLRKADAWMDMNPGNWVLRNSQPPYLLSLEPAVVMPADDEWPPFQNTFLLFWIGHRRPFHITAEELQRLRKSWEQDKKFLFWRKYFGPSLPEPGMHWKICAVPSRTKRRMSTIRSLLHRP
ncbi:hypothetical protein ACFL4G_00875 [Thermodesulfobacteriota bacterium]